MWNSEYEGYAAARFPILKRDGKWRCYDGTSYTSRDDALTHQQNCVLIRGNTKEERKQWLIDNGYLHE